MKYIARSSLKSNGTHWKTELQGLKQTESGQLNWLFKIIRKRQSQRRAGIAGGKWSVTTLALDATSWFKEGSPFPQSDREDEGEK